MGVLQTDEPSGEGVWIFRPDRHFNLSGVKDATICRDHMELHARQRGGSALLVPHDMGSTFDNDFVPRPGLDTDGQLVRHRAGWDKECVGLPKEGRGHFLETVDSGILPIDVIADLSASHHLAHCIRRLGDRIAAQINHCGFSSNL